MAKENWTQEIHISDLNIKDSIALPPIPFDRKMEFPNIGGNIERLEFLKRYGEVLVYSDTIKLPAEKEIFVWVAEFREYDHGLRGRAYCDQLNNCIYTIFRMYREYCQERDGAK